MILATRHQGDVERRTMPGVAVPTYNDWMGFTGTMSPRSITTIPAVSAAIRIASEAVALLDMEVMRGVDMERRRVTSTWQSRFFAGAPNEEDSWFLVWEWTEASLTARNNAYWVKHRSQAGQVESVDFVHPDLIYPTLDERGLKSYRVTRINGRTDQYQPADVVHFRGVGAGGMLFAPSPVELFRDVLRSASGKIRYESGFYERGMGQSLALLFPGNVTQTQAQQVRSVWESAHGGVENQHKLRVAGGGAQVQTIGITLRDAQYIESQQFSVDEIARMFNVPANLLGGGHQNRTMQPLTPEHEQTRWLRYGLAPRLRRIEEHLKADRDFFGPGSRDYPRFDSEDVVRGDLITEAQIALTKVQSGQWTPDEARALDGLPPLPGGVGQVPQITPVGGAPNPDTVPPPATPQQG